MNSCFRWLALSLALGFAAAAVADDWPQWLGPNRDSHWRETGIVKQFPADGLPVKWRVEVGLGYSGPAVVGNRVFVTDYLKTEGQATNNPGGRDKLEGSERIQCFDARDGKLLWKHEYERSYELSYPNGPRCTPTVADGKVYALGAEGNLLCLDAESGQVLWQKDFARDYGVKTPIWGHSAHPLVDGKSLYCVVGGQGSVAVAFDKDTGRELWRALSASEPGYCPPTIIEHGGARQLLIWHPEALNSLDPATGKLHWELPLKPAYRMSITAPRKLGDRLFASGIGDVAAMMKLDGEKPGAEVLWEGRAKHAVYCANSTPILEEGIIYGCDCRTGALYGVSMKDGERLWESFKPTTGERRAGHGTAFLVKHSNRYFLFSETGDLIMAKLSPEGYEELGRVHVLAPTNEAFGRDVVWAHPAFANRCLYARNDKELVCVDLSE